MFWIVAASNNWTVQEFNQFEICDRTKIGKTTIMKFRFNFIFLYQYFVILFGLKSSIDLLNKYICVFENSVKKVGKTMPVHSKEHFGDFSCHLNTIF